MSIFTNFIKGLKKSFDGKDYLRDINRCKECGNPSFFATCLKCEVDIAYRNWNKKSEE
tara:strand:- start:293 stop:466 length:174 start_codon:yes stop_codon:yes gene_type:complete